MFMIHLDNSAVDAYIAHIQNDLRNISKLPIQCNELAIQFPDRLSILIKWSVPTQLPEASIIALKSKNISTTPQTKVLGSIIKVPSAEKPSEGNVSFHDLECTSEDVQKITRLISVMGENGKLTLLLKYQKELRQIGREIEHVHPLKFLSITLSDPYLKSCMKKIHSDYFKWSNFMDGLANGLSVQAKQGKIATLLNDFAKTCNVPIESIQGYADRQEWENMAVYIINN